MSIPSFLEALLNASLIEYMAVITGIVSVWYSKKESVWVYPIGLINTLLYIYLSANASLFGESAVNLFYTIMSLYGWWCWTARDRDTKKPILHISKSSSGLIALQLLFFGLIFLGLILILTYLKSNFYPGTVPWADSLATAAAFTGMWLMTRKKLESWYWWILTNLVSIPLYIYKGYALTGVYYFILLGLAIAGLRSWDKKIKSGLAYKINLDR
ncbi:MAG: nicotinamide riboside transporter PnuC [Bacteroidetes bacterium]|nr:nicotinamide riboside transporter PnuC [Bacteroidota bacterium]